MRLWISGPRLFGGLVRPSISLGREDLRHRLPSWRQYEYQEALKAYAAKHDQPITNAQAAHDIDKAVAMGELDADGPVLHVTGTREEIIEGVMQAGEKYGMPVDRAEAERLTDKAIRPRFPWPVAIMAAILLAALVRAASP